MGGRIIYYLWRNGKKHPISKAESRQYQYFWSHELDEDDDVAVEYYR